MRKQIATKSKSRDVPLALLAVAQIFGSTWWLVTDSYAYRVDDATVVHYVATDVNNDEEDEEHGDDDSQNGACSQGNLMSRCFDSISC